VSALPCGCCEPAAPLTPLPEQNRAGLPAIAYRAGTYASFRETMLEQIAHTPELSRLTSREDDDYSVTVIDLWAAVADVLTFYQERYANEAFLRTATQTSSIARLARLIDYSLRPGAAALAWLAFTVDDGKTLKVPKRLRVQSVPGQNEQPQTFETLEEIQADARLNLLRAMPAPYGVKPLARGATQALIAPSDTALAAAGGLAAGDRILVYSTGAAGAVEELKLTAATTVEDRMALSWTGAVQGSWGFATPAAKAGRTFRLFGHTAPGSSMIAATDSSVPGGIAWSLQATNFGLSSGPTLALESRVEGIAAGTTLLVNDAAGATTVVTVTSVTSAPQSLAGLTDTVTTLTVTPDVPAIADRREVTLYELVGPPIPFWGYAYPERLAGGSLFLPGRRFVDGTIEVARKISRGRYQPGIRLAATDISPGRSVLIGDATTSPVAARVESVELSGSTVTVAPTARDATSAVELGLDAGTANTLDGLITEPLPASFQLARSAPELRAQIDGLPPRTLKLAGTVNTLSRAVRALRSALRTAGPEPEWSEVRVLGLRRRLLVFCGTPGRAIELTATATDGTTVRELGLDSDQALPISALQSAALSMAPSLSAGAPEIAVTVGPVGPRTVRLSNQPSLFSLGRALQNAIAGADPAPGFRTAQVLVVVPHLLVLAGPVGEEIAEYLRIGITLEEPLDLDAGSAYLLGNVAAGSHGQTVRSETVGDGDASASFQSMQLRKKPLTYVPSATPGGEQSTLEVLVSGVLWQEVPGFYGQSATAQVYTTRTQDYGTTVLRFGDGNTGATLPTGSGNVVATYRVGAGVAGRVRAQTLTTPLDRPPGLKGVTNPLAARGGADPETIDAARENAPSTVRTFGRAVSLMDFADLVRASGEVAKAQAIWVWDGFDRAVHLTVAGQAGGIFGDDDLRRIGAALALAREPDHRVMLDNYAPLPILLHGTIEVDDRHVQSTVLSAVRAAVLGALSFDAVTLGTPFHLSDLYRVIQDVEGVLASDIDELQPKRPADRDRPNVDRLADGSPAPLQTHVRVLPARPDPARAGHVLPAELIEVEDAARDVVLTATGGTDG
jgi:hypothetical protein